MSPPTVLVVDDTPTNLDLISRVLENGGYRVLLKRDGPSAVRLAAKRQPDIILLDAMMPDVDGYETCRRLKADEATADIPVLFMSALVDTGDKLKAFEAGAVDYIPKPFQSKEVLARIRVHIELREARRSLAEQNAELEAARRRIEDDLLHAARVQRSLLPAAPPRVPGFEFAWRYRPCDELAGDILDIVVLDEERVAFYVLDVSGHGVAAALLAVRVHNALLGLGPSEGPAELAGRLDGQFPMDRQTMQFFTICYGLLDPGSGRVRLVSAGHPPAILLRADGRSELLEATGPAVGVRGPSEFEEHAATLQAGDRLYLFSDGLIEAIVDDEIFGIERALESLVGGRATSLEDSIDRVLSAMDDWSGSTAPHDDVTILAVEATAGAVGAGR